MADDLPDAPWSDTSANLPDAPWASSPSFTDKLMQTWPVKAAQSLYSAVTLPGDVAGGVGDVAPKVPGQWSDEDEARLQLNNAAYVDRARDLASVATPVSAAARAGEGVMGVPLASTPIAPQVPAATIPELKAAAVAGYKTPVVQDVKIAASAGKRLADGIMADFNSPEIGIDENVAPKTFGILNKLRNVPEPEDGEPDPFLTVNNLRSLRRTLGNAAASPDPTERLAAKSAQQHVDEFLSNLDQSAPGDIISGNPNAAAAILKDANANYAAMSRAADLDTRMIRAQLRASAANSGMNIGNTIRQRMADILVNPKLQRGFSADEIAQMTKIVQGSATSNSMRFASNVLGGGERDAHSTVCGLGHAGVAPIAGYFLRKMYNAQTIQAAERLNAAVRMRAPLSQQRAAAAIPQQVRPSLSPVAPLRISVPFAAGSQSPVPVEAQPQQDGVPRPVSQQKYGGRIQQQRFAHGGKVSRFDPKSIGARKAKDGKHYLPDPRRPGKWLQVIPRA